MRISVYIILMVNSALISGCATTSDSSKPGVKNSVNAPSAWSALLTETLEPPESWTRNFNDPKLSALIEEGQRNNLDLRSVVANMDKAWLMAEKAGAALLPQANLSAGRSQSGTVDSGTSTSSVDIGLQVDWEVDLWGRIRSSTDASIAQAEATEADYIFAKHSLSANIVKSYLKLIEAKLQAQLTEENVAILEKTMRITEVKYANGLLTGQDMAVNRANLASASEQLIATEGAKREAARALEVLLGRYPDASLDIPDKLPELPSPPPAGLPSSVLERRPDIISAERQVAAAFAATDQAKAAQLPSLALSTSLGGSSESLSNVLSPSNIAWQLGSSLLVPVFDGGGREIDVKIANIEQQQAIDAYRQSALTAFSEVEQTLDNGLDLTRRVEALKEAYLQSKEALRIANIRYQEGENELLETLQIQQQMMSAKSSLLSARRSQLEQQVNLYLALGGDW